MSDQPPPNPLFDNAPGGSKDPTLGPDDLATESEKERIAHLREEIPKLLDQHREKGRSESFYPYLLIRTEVGDRGNRPLSSVFWESPDIWTASGDPGSTPAVPANPGGTLTAGSPNTIYAHVWNLGRAPILGVKVEFYWFNPSLAIDGANANLIGFARVDLQARNLPGCHVLVKCTSPWTPSFVNGGHECLIVRASAIGDPLNSPDSWDPRSDRHVGQRNIAVVDVAADISKLVSSLEGTRRLGALIQLSQVGQEALNAVRLVAPNVTVDPAVRTHVLAELRPTGAVMVPSPVAAAGGQPQAAGDPTAIVGRIQPHLLLRLGGASPGAAEPDGLKVDMSNVPPSGGPSADTAATTILERGGSVSHLLSHANYLAPQLRQRLKALQPPSANQAQVLRMATYEGDAIVGGYTIVIRGAEGT
jgi:hypothetical protein